MKTRDKYSVHLCKHLTAFGSARVRCGPGRITERCTLLQWHKWESSKIESCIWLMFISPPSILPTRYYNFIQGSTWTRHHKSLFFLRWHLAMRQVQWWQWPSIDLQVPRLCGLLSVLYEATFNSAKTYGLCLESPHRLDGAAWEHLGVWPDKYDTSKDLVVQIRLARSDKEKDDILENDLLQGLLAALYGNVLSKRTSLL